MLQMVLKIGTQTNIFTGNNNCAPNYLIVYKTELNGIHPRLLSEVKEGGGKSPQKIISRNSRVVVDSDGALRPL